MCSKHASSAVFPKGKHWHVHCMSVANTKSRGRILKTSAAGSCFLEEKLWVCVSGKVFRKSSKVNLLSVHHSCRKSWNNLRTKFSVEPRLQTHKHLAVWAGKTKDISSACHTHLELGELHILSMIPQQPERQHPPRGEAGLTESLLCSR